MRKVKILSRAEIFSSKLFAITEAKLEYPSGRKAVHHTVDRRPTVSIFPIDKNGDIILISEYRLMCDARVLEGAAGFIDEGESPLVAAKRELKEETGIMAKEWKKLPSIDIAASVIKGKSHIYLAKNLEFQKSTPEEGADIKIVKMKIEEAVQKVISGEIRTSVSVIGVLLLNELRREGKV